MDRALFAVRRTLFLTSGSLLAIKASLREERVASDAVSNKKGREERLVQRHSYGSGVDECGAQADGLPACLYLHLRRVPIYLVFQALHLVFEAQFQLLQPHFL